jgi:hypothetical protein
VSSPFRVSLQAEPSGRDLQDELIEGEEKRVEKIKKLFLSPLSPCGRELE